MENNGNENIFRNSKAKKKTIISTWMNFYNLLKAYFMSDVVYYQEYLNQCALQFFDFRAFNQNFLAILRQIWFYFTFIQTISS